MLAHTTHEFHAIRGVGVGVEVERNFNSISNYVHLLHERKWIAGAGQGALGGVRKVRAAIVVDLRKNIYIKSKVNDGRSRPGRVTFRNNLVAYPPKEKEKPTVLPLLPAELKVNGYNNKYVRGHPEAHGHSGAHRRCEQDGRLATDGRSLQDDDPERYKNCWHDDGEHPHRLVAFEGQQSLPQQSQHVRPEQRFRAVNIEAVLTAALFHLRIILYDQNKINVYHGQQMIVFYTLAHWLGIRKGFLMHWRCWKTGDQRV